MKANSGDLLRTAAGAAGSGSDLERALAPWLTDQADSWDRMIESTQSPSRGVDQPSGVHFGRPDAAAAHADEMHKRAIEVATRVLMTGITRPDHTAEALGLLREGKRLADTEEASNLLAAAHVHALLALTEAASALHDDLDFGLTTIALAVRGDDDE